MNNCVTNYLQFNGVTHIGESDHSAQLENNLKMFLDWAFLGIGGFFSAERNKVSASGAYGGDVTVLRKVKDPNLADGRVWETNRKDWVWESGQAYTDKDGDIKEPIQISGVYINGTFTSTGFYLDYPNGRVIFDTPKTGTIQLEYSYRYIQTYCASTTPWFNQLQFGSFRIDQGGFTVEGSNQWNVLAEKRVQMPAVVVEIVPRRELIPYEMGNISHFSRQDILFHILAETSWERHRLTDIFTKQQDKVFWLFDINKVLDSGAYPLNQNGSKVNNLTYQDLVSPTGYRWQHYRVLKTSTQNLTSLDPKLFRAAARWTAETVEGNI